MSNASRNPLIIPQVHNSVTACNANGTSQINGDVSPSVTCYLCGASGVPLLEQWAQLNPVTYGRRYRCYTCDTDPDIIRRHWKGGRAPRHCMQCGREFLPRMAAEFCMNCQRERDAKRRKEYQRKRREIRKAEARGEAWQFTVCDQCGEVFERQRVTARFCSARCRVAHHREVSR